MVKIKFLPAKKIVFLILFFYVLPFNLKSQDLIHEKNGNSIPCKITKIDTSVIYFDIVWNNRKINTHIARDSISGYQCNYMQAGDGSKSKYNTSGKYILSIDPVGIFSLGPSINVEFLVQGENSSIGIGLNVGLKFAKAGLLCYDLFGDGIMDFSYIIPLGLRFYPFFRHKSNGFFLGPRYEFGSCNYNGGSKYDIRIYELETGYKWMYKNGLTWELSDAIGYIKSRQISGTSIGNSMGSAWGKRGVAPFLLSLKVGYAF